MKNKDNNSKGNRSKNNDTYKWYKLFFSKYTFWGVIAILISIIVSIVTPIEECWQKIVFPIISAFLQTLGIAFVMGSIFDFSKNSKEFTEFISNLLSNIVVSKEFLSKLTKDDKTNALSLILKPTNNQLEQYSNINEYFLKKIDESTKMFVTNFKSHLCINLIAKYNSENKVIITGTMRYRIYKIQDKYEPLTLTFDDQNGKILKRRIISSDKIYDIDIDNEDVGKQKQAKGGFIYTEYTFEIPNELTKYKYLTIESEIEEIGFDHWTLFNWTSLTPYDGLSFTLICQDDLTVKRKSLFDNKEQYVFSESDDKKKLEICSTDWLDPYTGFAIVIAKQNGLELCENPQIESFEQCDIQQS